MPNSFLHCVLGEEKQHTSTLKLTPFFAPMYLLKEKTIYTMHIQIPVCTHFHKLPQVLAAQYGLGSKSNLVKFGSDPIENGQDLTLLPGILRWVSVAISAIPVTT